MQNQIQNIDSDKFQAEVIDSKLPVLVDFWAPWCGPCRMMAPVLEELNNASGGKYKIIKINVEEPANHKLAQEYYIRSIPNLKLFKDGKVIHEFVGVVDAFTLNKSISRVIQD